MIISHRHKFIFLKTSKTAGTSIEIALSGLCGERDIITPITPADEMIRNKLGHRGPQHHEASWFEYSPAEWWALLAQGKRKRKYYAHIHAADVRRYAGEKIWNNYYKFCFERNPWDRVISFYYWRFQDEPRPTMAEFLETDAPLLLRKNGYYLYTINDEVAVDRVCRYENLQEELDNIVKRLGLPAPLELPGAKASFRRDRRHYRDILTEENRDKIAELFAREVSLFGYEF